MASSAHAAPAFLRLAAHPLRWRLLSELAVSDYRVRELVDLLGQPQNLVSYHLRLLREGGLVTMRRSTFDARDGYYHLDLDRCARALAATGAALHPALRPGPVPPPAPASGHRPAVLFTCTGNSARSPIAEALLRHRAGGHVEVTSAGSRPRPRLHLDAVRALREGYGIDLRDLRPRHLDSTAGRRFDYVISLCDKVREVCSGIGGHPRRIHWSIPDPAADGAGYPAFVRTAAEIDTRIGHLLPVLTSQEAST
ncbi:ArsR family transcriptional regulator [Planobispora siamensis]|uniref:ArsR family transcriptional regulator n=1 Tax=Planobispora siamensis TaxID=936338 RepID=A0A8J3WMC0_9ACTN|nr:ArsR family transcriptional regulator [Planobispora siamensis]GIH96289.1 ArsR family transcriptional regulator [Planobispora siamensis]